MIPRGRKTYHSCFHFCSVPFSEMLHLKVVPIHNNNVVTYRTVVNEDLLSAFYCFNVNGVDAISMDSVYISVRIQLQTKDPL